MAQVSISALIRRARWRDTTECPVSGLVPPAARNSPALASWLQVMASAQ